MAKQTKAAERWSAEQAREMLKEAERSGLSDRAFGRERGIDAQRLRWWRARLAEPQKAKVEAGSKMKFAELVQRRARQPDAAIIEIELANGRRLKVPSTIDAELLRRVLEAVENRRC